MELCKRNDQDEIRAQVAGTVSNTLREDSTCEQIFHKKILEAQHKEALKRNPYHDFRII